MSEIDPILIPLELEPIPGTKAFYSNNSVGFQLVNASDKARVSFLDKMYLVGSKPFGVTKRDCLTILGADIRITIYDQIDNIKVLSYVYPETFLEMEYD